MQGVANEARSPSALALGSSRGKVVIGTLEERKEAAEKILKKFWEACWMYDHKDEAEAEVPDFGTMQPA